VSGTKERRHLLRIQLAQAFEADEPGELPDAEQAQLGVAQVASPEPIQLPDPDGLVVEAGVEPPDDFFVVGEAAQVVFLPPQPVR